jgi:hypothetical protein
MYSPSNKIEVRHIDHNPHLFLRDGRLRPGRKSLRRNWSILGDGFLCLNKDYGELNEDRDGFVSGVVVLEAL